MDRGGRDNIKRWPYRLHDIPKAYNKYSEHPAFRKEPVHDAPIPERMFSLPLAVKFHEEIPPGVAAPNTTEQRVGSTRVLRGIENCTYITHQYRSVELGGAAEPEITAALNHVFPRLKRILCQRVGGKEIARKNITFTRDKASAG